MLHPSCDSKGDIQISVRTVTKRRAETFAMAKKIHGCKAATNQSSMFGLIDALSVKFKKTELATQISKNDKLCNKVFPVIYNNKVAEFEVCNDNVVRSVAMYFSKGVMGKAKYKSVYKILSMKKDKKDQQWHRLKVASCNIPRLLPYNKLMPFVKGIDFL